MTLPFQTCGLHVRPVDTCPKKSHAVDFTTAGLEGFVFPRSIFKIYSLFEKVGYNSGCKKGFVI